MKFFVSVPEVHYQMYEIEADSESDAINKIVDGDGDPIYLEYSHTMDKLMWRIERDV